MGQSEIISIMKNIEHPSLKLFKKEKYIGHGGFGHVWKVLFSKSDYYLAMKQLSKQKIIKSNFVTNIFYERDILNILYNIHIVNLYLTFQDENYLYMIMDYLDGGDLRKHMKSKIFNLKEIKFVAACVIIGLEYIHKKGIIHRDIKPENLIFDDKGYLRISDFGIAIRNDLINILEKNNDKSGTPGYMAPERIINSKNISYSYSSDFFSLGVILYELTMLKKPFRRNIDKIGKVMYNTYEDIISDLFNNESVNLTPSLVKKYRNTENNNANININKKEINEYNTQLVHLCDLINKLLIYEQKDRLGYDDIEDIKNHPFFGESFEWKKIFHRSYNSPFIIYDNSKNKNKKNEKKDLDDISKSDKIEEEKNNFQKKFENFTLIHKITKEDFNYFYLSRNISGNLSIFRNNSHNRKKYQDSNKRNIKKTFTVHLQKNIKFFSQTKTDKKDNKQFNSSKYKIMPYQLFKENNNNLININNKNNNSNLIKNYGSKSKKNNKINMEIIEENFMNKFNKTNINMSKIMNLKDKIANLNKNKFNLNFYPLINSSRESRKNKIKKPLTAMLYKKRNNSIVDNKRNARILLVKNSFGDAYHKSLVNSRKSIKQKNDIHLTDSNDNLFKKPLNTSRDIHDNLLLLRNNGKKIINEKEYKDKIIELNNHNIDKALKEIFMH